DGGSLPVTAKFTMSLANTSGSAGVALADGTVIDSVQWASEQDGLSSQLEPQKLDSSLNDDPANFCAATQTYASGDKGTPGAANTACVAQPNGNSCVDPDTGATRPLMSPVVGDVVISELMPDPNFVSDTTGEWFEVYVPGDVDLNGVKLGNETTSSTTLSSPACIHPVAGSYVLFAKNADSSVNGGLPPVLSTFGFSLSNTGPHIIKLSLGDGGVLDSVTYNGSVGGVSTQLDPGSLDPVANDNAAAFCPSDAGSYDDAGINVGTPGAANTPCQ
ncbi:MAG: lamin tail domain-containing protein, partial [Myxococcaceae bacterium]